MSNNRFDAVFEETDGAASVCRTESKLVQCALRGILFVRITVVVSGDGRISSARSCHSTTELSVSINPSLSSQPWQLTCRIGIRPFALVSSERRQPNAFSNVSRLAASV